jgi:N-acetylneuraminic acid mutarotase
MQRYDPAANTVTAMAPMPVGNFAHAVVAQGTKVYVLGGSSTGIAGSTNYIYDTVANTWSSGAAVPTAVQYPAAASDGTYIYLLGGNTTDHNIVHDPDGHELLIRPANANNTYGELK